MMKEIKQNEKGFTLVELVVVIAILAILAALLVPRIIGNVKEANNSREYADARTIASEVTTHNAIVRVGNDPTKIKTIPEDLAVGAGKALTDGQLEPIGREGDKTLANMDIYEVSVDKDGNATAKEKKADKK